MESLFSTSTLSVMAAIAASLLAGYLVGRVRRRPGSAPSRRAESGQVDLQRSMEHLQKSFKDLAAEAETARRERAEMSRVLAVLPDLLRNLTSSVTLKDIHMAIVTIVRSLTDARLVLFYSAQGSAQGDILILRTAIGLNAEAARDIKEVRIGEGRIGTAALKRITMDAGDFQNESILIREGLRRAGDKDLPLTVVSPVVQRDSLLGVIVMGEMEQVTAMSKRILGIVGQLSAIAIENHQLFQEVKLHADVDMQTRLYNATYFRKYLETEINKARRFHRPLSLVWLDIDHFRSYNETSGHEAGDEVLRIVGRLVKDSTRAVDIPCRVGGQAFSVILPETAREGAARVAETVRGKVEAHEMPLAVNQPGGRITVSAGVAIFPEDGNHVDSLVRSVEEAVRYAKQRGRNRVEAQAPPWARAASD
ncbi:MAG: diguanylate cyclase [Nitrospirae bacterium]|nr:diguanylate cyclase [Nitrospirota bacterium]